MPQQKGLKEKKENERLKYEMAEAELGYSTEKNKAAFLETKNGEAQYRIMHQERELIDLRATNVRLSDSEAQVNKELENFRERNITLMSENENMRRQMRAQEDAILQA